jgi:hypothetical protein
LRLFGRGPFFALGRGHVWYDLLLVSLFVRFYYF